VGIADEDGRAEHLEQVKRPGTAWAMVVGPELLRYVHTQSLRLPVQWWHRGCLLQVQARDEQERKAKEEKGSHEELVAACEIAFKSDFASCHDDFVGAE
jgi:hypothetical protein